MTFPRKLDSTARTPSTSTRNWDSSRVRDASARAAVARRGSSFRSPGYSSLTIHAQEPDGTTTCSERAKRSTVRAATCAASP